jgi:hypothetical protein
MASSLQEIPVTSEQPAPVLITKGKYRFPPGLRYNLPAYLFSKFFKPGNPILLFEHLAKFGRAAHYRLLWNHIVLLNDPSDIREVLVDKAQFFIKERTQKRMKILLGDGLITADGEPTNVIAASPRPPSTASASRPTPQPSSNTPPSMREEWQAGKQIDIAAEMMRLALQITARTLFDTEVTPEIHTINDEANAVMEMYNALIALPRAELLLRWRIPIPVLIRFRKSKAPRFRSRQNDLQKQAEIARANTRRQTHRRRPALHAHRRARRRGWSTNSKNRPDRE